MPNQITSHGEKLYNLCPLNFVFILGFGLILILRIIKSILSMVDHQLLVLKIQVIFLWTPLLYLFLILISLLQSEKELEIVPNIPLPNICLIKESQENIELSLQISLTYSFLELYRSTRTLRVEIGNSRGNECSFEK